MADNNGIFDFSGRRIVVTGAARGIGYSIARLAAASGGAVAVLDLEGANPEAAASKLRDEVKSAEIVSENCDVSSYDTCPGGATVLVESPAGRRRRTRLSTTPALPTTPPPRR